MTSKAKEESKYLKTDPDYLSWFVYDVLIYTLPKCGFPETEFPYTNYKRNIYNSANFVETVGTLVLKISLNLRDPWKKKFEKQFKSLGFNEKNINNILRRLINCLLRLKPPTEKAVQVALALGNEIMLFFRHKGIDIGFKIITESICLMISCLLLPKGNFSEIIEGLVGKYGNISQATRCITDFITKFAVPYASRDGVSNLFSKEYRDWIEYESLFNGPKANSIAKLVDYLGFLPHDLHTAMLFEESVVLPKNLVLASEWILPGDRESPEPPKLSGSGAVEGNESHWKNAVDTISLGDAKAF